MIAPPAIIAITDTERGEFERWLAQLERLLALAAPDRVLLMLRDRQLPVRERLSLGQRLRELTRRHGQRFSVNDRLDLAVLLDADAVHLAESSVAASDARAFARSRGRSFWLSRAAHQPHEAAHADADALLLSPIAEARKGRPALGVAGVEAARAARERRTIGQGPCALYALGGISGANAAACVRAGADGVALIGALLEPDAPRALVEQLNVRR
jgi:thiamine-phosphate pyrophosphorylase